MKRMSRFALLLSLLGAASAPAAAWAQDNAAPVDRRPLSPAQVKLFETPHLQNVTTPETLEYRFTRTGPGAFTDTITEAVEKIHPDGSKYVSFNFMTGDHHVVEPAIDQFHGNPLLMLFLSRDAKLMREETGVAAAYYRHDIREAFVDQARVEDSTVTVGGRQLPAQRITLQPFLKDKRFEHVPEIQNKTYSFILSDQVPGQLVELRAEQPGDPKTETPTLVETISFTGVKS